jgi:HEAT repeat protein
VAVSTGQEIRSVKQHEASLLESLKNAKTVIDRVRFLRLLPAYGADAAVPVIAPLLGEQDQLLREEACRALQPNPSPAAGKALIAALDKAKEPTWKVALLEALGARREAAALTAVRKCLDDADPRVVEAAAFATGRAGGPDAAAALKAALAKATPRSKKALWNGYLDCADGLRLGGKTDQALAIYQEAWKSDVRNARVRGLLAQAAVEEAKALPLALGALHDGEPDMVAAGLRILRTMPKNVPASAACVGEMPKLTPEVQALAWYALASRGDVSVLPAALAAVKSEDLKVKRAALWVIGTFGDAACIGVALPLAANGEGVIQAEARRTLRRLHGKEAPEVMMELLPKADPKTQIELIGALADTGATDVIPPLLSLAAGNADQEVRMAAYTALRRLADTPDLPALVDLMLKRVRPGDEDAAVQTVSFVCANGKDHDTAAEILLKSIGETSESATKATLLGLLGQTGSPKALATLRRAVEDSDEKVRDGGVRALASWPDGSVSADLLKLAQQSPSKTHRILALQGYLRLVHVPWERPLEDKLAMCREARELAKRVEEKRLWLVALGDVACLGAVEMAAEMLDDASVTEEAAAAAWKSAQGFAGQHRIEFYKPENLKKVKAVMEKVLSTSKYEGSQTEAKRVLDWMPK